MFPPPGKFAVVDPTCAGQSSRFTGTRAPATSRRSERLLDLRFDVDLQPAAQGVRDGTATLRLLRDVGELGGGETLEPLRHGAKPGGQDLQPALAEIGPDGCGDVQPARLRVLASDR